MKLVAVTGIAVLAATLMAQEPAPAAAAVQPQVTETQTAPNAREIVRKSVDLDQRNARLIRRNYTWQMRVAERDVDKDGNVKKTKIETFDHVFLYGRSHERLIAKNDQPLTPKQEQEEENKIEKLKDKSEHESDADRQKREAARDQQIAENRKFLLQIPEAYDFELKGSQTIAGRDTWVIGLTPRAGFKPTVKYADIFKKIKGTLWIDKQEYQWVKADAELLDDATFGLFLVRLHKGARLRFEQTKVNDEVWFMRWSRVEGSARVALFLNARGDEETTFSNYRKFKADAKITGVSELPVTEAPKPPR
jgi:hypothetical protein